MAKETSLNPAPNPTPVYNQSKLQLQSGSGKIQLSTAPRLPLNIASTAPRSFIKGRICSVPISPFNSLIMFVTTEKPFTPHKPTVGLLTFIAITHPTLARTRHLVFFITVTLVGYPRRTCTVLFIIWRQPRIVNITVTTVV